eukprot:PhM_4_TR2148/c0_g1_i1/m.87414
MSDSSSIPTPPHNLDSDDENEKQQHNEHHHHHADVDDECPPHHHRSANTSLNDQTMTTLLEEYNPASMGMASGGAGPDAARLTHLLSLACDEIRALRDRVTSLEGIANNDTEILRRQNDFLKDEYKRIGRIAQRAEVRLRDSLLETNLAIERAAELQKTAEKLAKENKRLRALYKDPVAFDDRHPVESVNSINNKSISRTKRELMLRRIRRAMAPATTPEQMSLLVQGMVKELQDTFISNGMLLPLTLVGGDGSTTYVTSAKKKIRLAVHSNVLMVQVGAGYEDFVDYVDRHKLWRPVS